QCTLNSAASSSSGSGNTLTVNVSVTFAAGFAGQKNVYLSAGNIAGQNSGWQNLGTWTVGGGTNPPPTADSVSPNSGGGSSQLFTFVYSDPRGYTDLHGMFALFNSSQNPANACYVLYSRPTNALYLMADNGSTLMGPVVPGSSATLQNTQCT